MKNTIKLTTVRSLTVEPCAKARMVCLSLVHGAANTSSEPIYLTADQVGALLFALEMAAENLDMCELRAAA